jgi:hypothetical protein
VPESSTHSVLVENVVDWIRQNVPSIENAVLLIDAPTAAPGTKPQAINGYCPDVYCRSKNGEHILIGEAKSAGGVETNHSRQQFEAYLRHLMACQQGTLVVAVPWHAVARASSLLRGLQRKTNTSEVRLVFLEKLPG